jgi:hypothetical protein
VRGFEARSLGYEPKKIGNFNNLQDAGGARKPCKERVVIVIGQLMDSRRMGVDFRSAHMPSRSLNIAMVAAMKVRTSTNHGTDLIS